MDRKEIPALTLEPLPERSNKVFLGPEAVQGERFEVSGEELHAILDAVFNDPSAIEKIAEFYAGDIEHYFETGNRLPARPDLWDAIKSHTPENKWPSVCYFNTHTFHLVGWHAVKDHPRVKKLVEDGKLTISLL